MSDEGQGDVIDLPARPKLPPRFNIKDLLSAPPAAAVTPQAEPQPPEPDGAAKGDVLPQPGDPYVAFATPRGVAEPTLHVLLRDGTYRGFAWSNYDGIDLLAGEAPGSGPVLVLRFDGLRPTEVRITGQRHGLLHAYLGQQRIGWIREKPEGKIIADAHAPVIEKITLSPFKP